MRATWTDERLDDLKDEVVRTRDEVARQGARIDALNQTILTVGGRLFAASITVVVAIVGLIATQL